MAICRERCADLHMARLMPLPLTVSCFSKIRIGFTFLVPAHLGSPGQRAVKRVCVIYLFIYIYVSSVTVNDYATLISYMPCRIDFDTPVSSITTLIP